MIRLAMLIWCLALPASAQVARVTSGEHDGFTRVVVHLQRPADWSLLRNAQGYSFGSPGAERFDLTEVFRPIGRNRLSAIWADPDSGDLQLRIACACHAVPFEYGPGVIVIDLRDGPPPEGSYFELSVDGTPLPPLAASDPPRPRQRPATPAADRQPAFPGGQAGYDWKTIARHASPPQPAMPDLPAGALPDPALSPWRDSLLRALAGAAGDGLIDLGLPHPPATPVADTGGAQVRIGGSPSLLAAPGEAALAANGRMCPAPERLALQDWITEAPVAAQFGPATAGLIGEFDEPDPASVVRAVRFLLAAGFGAEAEAMLAAFPLDHADEPLWRSLARITDDLPDAAPAFEGFSACDGPAALWSLMSDPPPAPGTALAADAVSGAFSALPADLRRQLGPRLVMRLTALSETSAAETVRAAMRRAGGSDDPAAMVMEAGLALAAGDPAMAETLAKAVIARAGPQTPAALATLVEARVVAGLPVDPGQITAIEALLRETGTGPDHAPLTRALSLAHAGAGDFDGAFAAAADSPEVTPMIWAALADFGSDDSLMQQALPRGPSPAARSRAGVIAARLIDLGLGDAAGPWLAAMTQPDPILAAKAAMARWDARAALRAIAGQTGDEAEALRARALAMMGDNAAAGRTYAVLGDDTERQSALIRDRDWQAVAAEGEEPWRSAALASGNTGSVPDGTLDAGNAPPDPETAPAPADGPIARARTLVGDSRSARATVETLLAETRIAP